MDDRKSNSVKLKKKKKKFPAYPTVVCSLADGVGFICFHFEISAAGISTTWSLFVYSQHWKKNMSAVCLSRNNVQVSLDNPQDTVWTVCKGNYWKKGKLSSVRWSQLLSWLTGTLFLGTHVAFECFGKVPLTSTALGCRHISQPSKLYAGLWLHTVSPSGKWEFTLCYLGQLTRLILKND